MPWTLEFEIRLWTWTKMWTTDDALALLTRTSRTLFRLEWTTRTLHALGLLRSRYDMDNDMDDDALWTLRTSVLLSLNGRCCQSWLRFLRAPIYLIVAVIAMDMARVLRFEVSKYGRYDTYVYTTISLCSLLPCIVNA